MDIIDHISEVNPEALLLDGFDDAIIGLAERINLDKVVAYDVEKILEIMCVRDEMTYEEAYEYYEYNIKGAFMGEFTPVFVEVYDPEEYLVNPNTAEREVVKVDSDEFDFTSKGPWEVDGHKYIFIEDKLSDDFNEDEDEYEREARLHEEAAFRAQQEKLTTKLNGSKGKTKMVNNIELPPKGNSIEVEVYELPEEMKEGECDCGPNEACPKCMDKKDL